jgi:hypothetical protein
VFHTIPKSLTIVLRTKDPSNKQALALLVMEQQNLKIVNNCLNTNIYSYLETSGGQSSNLYFKVIHFSTPVLIRHLWQLKTIVFLHWCLLCALLLLKAFSRSNTLAYSLGASVAKKTFVAVDTWAQCYKTFYICNS